MKQIIRIILVTTLSALSACDRSPAPEQTPPPAATNTAPAVEVVTEGPSLPAGQYELDLSDGAIVIRANQVNELVLFKGLAHRAKFQLLAESFEWKTVSVDIHADTLQAAVVELVSAYPYEIVHAPTESGQEVLSEVVIGKPEPVTAENKDEKKKKALEPGREALLYIKEYSPEEQQRVYMEKLQDPMPEIRAAAAKELMPTSDNLQTLTDLLANDPSPEVRISATWPIEVSEEEEAPQAIAALVKCLSDEDHTVVAACVKSLGFIGDETTIVYLQPMLTHPDEDVRIEALEAIRWLQ
jgi:hypothetical protein